MGLLGRDDTLTQTYHLDSYGGTYHRSITWSSVVVVSLVNNIGTVRDCTCQRSLCAAEGVGSLHAERVRPVLQTVRDDGGVTEKCKTDCK